VPEPLGDPQADLIALVAHDLRNPLAAIVANLCYLRSAIASPEPELDGALADAELACARIEKMTQNLGVMAKARLGPPPERHPASLCDLAYAAVLRARAVAQMSRVELKWIERRAPHVLVNGDLFGLALDNLIGNAVQYSPAGRAVAVELSAGRGRAAVTVVDDGPIIPELLRDAVFRIEGQAQTKGRLEARYGLGLALYAARQAAVLAGAELAIKEMGGKNAFEISADVIAER
jgi:signal transduction histidine kinase